MRAEDAFRFDAARLQNLSVPTLLLAGGESPAILRQPNEMLSWTLPYSRLAVLPEQKHIDMYTAPELFLSEVTGFLAV